MHDPLEIFRREILSLLTNALRNLDYEMEPAIERAPPGKGDFTFPCFQAATEHDKKPPQAAEEISYVIGESKHIKKHKNVGPYINFYVNDNLLCDSTLKIILDLDREYGKHPPNDINVILEHTSANPTGPFHVGRARNPILGDSLARIMRKAGYHVETQYWVNNMGKQAVILTYGVERCDPAIPTGDEEARDKDDHKLVLHYRAANSLMEEDPDVAGEIGEWLRKVETGDPELVSRVKAVCERVLTGMKESLSGINVNVDHYVWESQTLEDGSATDVVERLKKAPLARSEEGAFYLELEGHVQGKDTRFFFTRKDGTTLYTTRDVAYHIWKLRRCDLALNVLGEDHKLESKQLEIALKSLGYERVPDVVFYAFVNLPEGSMSTRKGRVVTLDDLVDEAVARARTKVDELREDLSDAERAAIARIVGTGALRFNIIRIQPEKSMTFRWDEALSFEGKSAPFVQYSHARACSILRKAVEEGKPPGMWSVSDIKDEEELKLVRLLASFPSLLRECAERRLAHPVATYAHELAVQFNQFYRDVPVLKSRQRNTRLALVECAKIVLRNALDVLGIEAPERM
jgi:arginyl-tRNA synthetase